MMMKQPTFGINKSECQRNEFSAEIWLITSGRWAFLVHADRVLRFIMIVVRHMAQKVGRLLMRIDIWKFGTLFSCRTNEVPVAEKIVIRFWANFRQKVLILDLD